MDRLHARYPFLDDARRSVEAADVDLAALVEAGGPAVARGRKRVTRALLEGTTDPEDPRAWSDRAELLSYPIARVLVSLLDVPGAIEKYAAAEAATARTRFQEDFEAAIELKSTDDRRLNLNVLLDDLDLLDRVVPTGDNDFKIAVTAYLDLASALDADRWRLAQRPLAEGWIAVSRPEFYTLLRESIQRLVADGLPLAVPDSIADSLSDEVSVLRHQIEDLEPPIRFDTTVPGLFPPCMRALLTRARTGEALPDRSRFSLLAFLANTGLEADEIVELCDVSDKDVATTISQQVAHLRDDDGAVMTSPSCEVMQEYGDCVDKDELCEQIHHPLSYYDEQLDAVPEDRLATWTPQ